jgi:hypothetical protein
LVRLMMPNSNGAHTNPSSGGHRVTFSIASP